MHVALEPLHGGLAYHVTEHGGAGMSLEEAKSAIIFGRHTARADAKALQNYSHNGVGTKACLKVFSRLAIFSIAKGADGRRGYVLLLLDVADHGDHSCRPARFLTWADAASGNPDWGGPHHPEAERRREIFEDLTYLAPEEQTAEGIAKEFGRIGETGSRFVYFGSEGREELGEEAKCVFIPKGDDVEVHPKALPAAAGQLGEH